MNFVSAIRSIVESWQRAVLSAIGVMVGSIAIILLVSIGIGVQSEIRGEVEELGANTLIVMPGRFEMGTMNPNLSGQSYLTEENRQAVSQVEGVLNTALFAFVGGGITAGDREAYPLLTASDAEWFQMHNAKLREGRFYEAGSSAFECVLGGVAARQLFPDSSAVGQKVDINDQEYTVVGVMESGDSEQSLFSMQGFQNVAYIPYLTFVSSNPSAQIDRIMIQSDPAANPEILVAELERVLSKSLQKSQYSVLTQEDLLGLIYQVMGILGTLVTGLTSIALFVAGVGVMTVMMITVNERRKEIGMRKAAGATKQDIFWQFLYEAVIIGLGGVILGLIVSIIVITILDNYSKIHPELTAATVLLALGVGVGIGAIFGIWPAMRAASQDPIVSLRNE